MRLTITCQNSLCGIECVKDWQPSRPPPRYCSISCAKVHANAEKKRLGVAVWRKYTFTPAMDAALRLAYRGPFGSLRRLWRDDPRFERAGIPYPLIKRQCKILGLTKTMPDDTWLPDESALCQRLYQHGYALETIIKKLKAAGYTRSPSSIVGHMSILGQPRREAFLSVSQFAIALGVDWHVVKRWITAGLLPVAYTTDGGSAQFLSYPAMRQFVLNYPLKATQGATDKVWLIALLVPPKVGNTREHGRGDATTDTSWLTGEVIRDRAAAD